MFLPTHVQVVKIDVLSAMKFIFILFQHMKYFMEKLDTFMIFCLKLEKSKMHFLDEVAKSAIDVK